MLLRLFRRLCPQVWGFMRRLSLLQGRAVFDRAENLRPTPGAMVLVGAQLCWAINLSKLINRQSRRNLRSYNSVG